MTYLQLLKKMEKMTTTGVYRTGILMYTEVAPNISIEVLLDITLTRESMVSIKNKNNLFGKIGSYKDNSEDLSEYSTMYFDNFKQAEKYLQSYLTK
jgi:hypothetical protein